MAWACAMSVSLASWAKASKSSCWFCSATGSGRARRTSAASRFAKSSTMKVPIDKTAETAPTQPDRHLQLIAERGRMGWQKASGYNLRALVEADIGRWKRVIGEALHCRRTAVRRPTWRLLSTS